MTLDRDWLDARIAAMIDEGETPAPDESLIHHGLDSVRVMALVGALEERGVRVTFEELIETPTPDAWWTLLSSRPI